MRENIIRRNIILYVIAGCLLSVFISLSFTGCSSSGVTTLPADIQVTEITQGNNDMADLDTINQKYIQNKDYNSIIIPDKAYRKKLLMSKQISDDIKQFSYEICQKYKVIIRYMETDILSAV